MILQSLRIKGSYAGDLAVPIEQLTGRTCAIMGTNGSGKTTTFESAGPGAVWLRSPSRGTLYDMFREADGLIEAVWAVNGKSYTHRVLIDAIHRNTEAYLSDRETHDPIAGGGAREYLRAVGERYPTLATYLASAYGAQGGEGRFLSLEPADRKALFARMIGAEALEEMAVTAGKRGTEQKSALERAAGKREALEGRASETPPDLRGAESSLEDARKIRVAAERINAERRDEREKWKLATADLRSQIQAARNAEHDADARMGSAEQRRQEAAAECKGVRTLLEARSALEATAAVPVEDITKYREHADKLKAEVAAYKPALLAWRGRVSARESLITSAEMEIERASSQAKALEEVPCHGEGEYAACPLIGSAQRAKGSLDRGIAELERLKAEPDPVCPEAPDEATLAEIEGRIKAEEKKETAAAEAKVKLAALSGAQAKLESLMAEIEMLQAECTQEKATRDLAHKQVEDITLRLADLPEPPQEDEFGAGVAATEERKAQARVVEAQTLITTIEKAKADLEVVRQEEKTAAAEVDDWITLQKVLRHIKALEIDAAGPEASAITNDLLHSCYGARYTVKLITQEVRSKKGAGMKETFDLQVLDGEKGTEGSAAKKSGGEQVIISEALSMAIALYNGRKSGVPMLDLFRDERDYGLSPEHTAAYYQMIVRACEIGQLHRIYFVTHNPALAAMADERLVFADGKVTVA